MSYVKEIQNIKDKLRLTLGGKSDFIEVRANDRGVYCTFDVLFKNRLILRDRTDILSFTHHIDTVSSEIDELDSSMMYQIRLTSDHKTILADMSTCEDAQELIRQFFIDDNCVSDSYEVYCKGTDDIIVSGKVIMDNNKSLIDDYNKIKLSWGIVK